MGGVVSDEWRVRSYQDLVVWQKSMELVERVYRMTKVFPKEEVYGLSSQMRHAVVSIPSNIAEGQAHRTTADFLNFLSIAQGSRAKVETQTLIAQRLGYVTSGQISEILSLLEEISKMLNALRVSSSGLFGAAWRTGRVAFDAPRLTDRLPGQCRRLNATYH